MTALAAIVERYRGQMTILVDSGFRRGSDIVKALALGADGVLLGRAALYGLAAGGEAGASRALDILAEEMRRVMALLGVTSVGSLDAGFLSAATSSGARKGNIDRPLLVK
jgi:(S)-mandelate dehydrogenase